MVSYEKRNQGRGANIIQDQLSSNWIAKIRVQRHTDSSTSPDTHTDTQARFLAIEKGEGITLKDLLGYRLAFKHTFGFTYDIYFDSKTFYARVSNFNAVFHNFYQTEPYSIFRTAVPCFVLM